MFWDDITYNRSWSPWQEVNRLQDEVNRIFSGTRETHTGSYPAINIWTNNEGAVMTAEVPGMDPASLDVSVLADTVTLRCERKPQELKPEEQVHRCERPVGQFTRTIQLPFKADAGKVSAEFTRGVLKVIVPRAADDMPRKISVRSA